MNIKLIFTIIATAIGTFAFVPYLKDIFSFKTKPHAYSWLIWLITQGTAVVGIWYGGGGLGALNLTIGTLCVFVVFIFSLKYGTKNITKTDTITLVVALCAILVWWQLHQPLISIIMVTVIDFLGYIPTFRKSYHEPWSESLISWVAFFISNVFAVMALKEYNALTMTYIIVLGLIELILFLFCIFRRFYIRRPDNI